MRITWDTNVNAPACPGQIVAKDGRTILVQLDSDFPGVASSFGWSTRSVQNAERHDADDFLWTAECGVFKCVECGHAFYPCELEEFGMCPECGGSVHSFLPCDHDGTDGTIDCPCGVTALQFIAAARKFLNANDGASADDPGYFD